MQNWATLPGGDSLGQGCPLQQVRRMIRVVGVVDLEAHLATLPRGRRMRSEMMFVSSRKRGGIA